MRILSSCCNGEKVKQKTGLFYGYIFYQSPNLAAMFFMETKDNMCSVKIDFLSYAVENWNQSSSHPSDPEVGEKVIGHLQKNSIHCHSLHSLWLVLVS